MSCDMNLKHTHVYNKLSLLYRHIENVDRRSVDLHTYLQPGCIYLYSELERMKFPPKTDSALNKTDVSVVVLP
jgi:hypothetical protein